MPCRLRLLIAFLAAVLSHLTCAHQAAGQEVLRRVGLASDGVVRLTAQPDEVEGLLKSRTGERVEVALPMAEGPTLRLSLERFEVTTSQTLFSRAAKGRTQAMAAPRVLLLRGEVAGEPGSRVFLALTTGGAGSGSITRGTGEQWHIASERTPGGAELILRPGAGDWPEVVEFCRIHPSPDMGGERGGSPAQHVRGVRVLRMAVEADQAFVQLFQSEAEAQEYIVQLVAAVSDIYIRDLNFKIILAGSRLWPEEAPFSAANLGGFRTWWLNNNSMAGLNLVHLFSGRRDLGYGGIAYLANGCSTFAFGISGFLLGHFPQPPTHAQWGMWDIVVVAHEIGHNLSTPHTHDFNPPIDQCTSGVEERGTIMSYCHTRTGGLLNLDLQMHTRVADYIAGNNPPESCLWHDCNRNGQDDSIDIARGASQDVNNNGIPDECEDCNGNGILDTVEIANGAPDINGNGILDECEPDCNGNGIPDVWEIANGMVTDYNGNGIPDACEPDCDGNGIADHRDIWLGTHTDVDRNRVPDVCQDCNRNGVPDWIDVDRQFNIFVGQVSGSVREYHGASGVIIREIGAGVVDGAYDLVFGSDRQLYVASFNDHRVVRIDIDRNIATDFVAAGAGGLLNPAGLVFGADGHLYVASQGNSSVIRYHGQTGQMLGVFVPAGSGELNAPYDLTFGPNGNLFVVSSGNRVLEFDGVTGAYIGDFVQGPGSGLDQARALLFLSTGELLVTSRGNNRIMKFATNGEPLGQFNDKYPLPLPWSIALSRNGNVLAARSTATDLRVVEYRVATGIYERALVRGDAGLNAPTSIALRPPSPNDINGNDIPDECEKAPCPADIAPPGGDGIVNVNDLLAVVHSWGPCPVPCPPLCGADITADCSVNVNDLLAVINAWGPCR